MAPWPSEQRQPASYPLRYTDAWVVVDCAQTIDRARIELGGALCKDRAQLQLELVGEPLVQARLAMGAHT
jgi:hypothetical protein